MKATIVSVVIFTLLLLGVVPVTYAQSCSNPGAGNTTDLTYDNAANTYVICNVLSAQATIMAYTPTPTATLAPTPAAVLSQTGCDAHDKPSLYQDCVTNDAAVRRDSYLFWTIPLILVAIIAFGVTRKNTIKSE